MVLENSENTPGYFLPVSSLGFYSNAFPSDWGNQIQIPFKKMRLQNLDRGNQHTHKESSKFLSLHHKDPAPYSGIYWGNQIPIPFKKMRFQNLDRVNRLTHEESCEFISLDQNVRQNEAEQNQQGSFPHYLAQFRNNNSEKIKASPEFQSLEPEGRQEKVEQQGFRPLIVKSTQENDAEKFRLISSEFPSLPGFEEESKGFQLFSTQPKDQQVRFQPSNLLALEIFEQNKSIPKKNPAQFGEIGSVNWFLNQPNLKPYRKPAL